MSDSRIIRGIVNDRMFTITSPITQWDYGWVFVPEVDDLPETYRLDFSNDEHSGTALPIYCGAEGAEVPVELINTGKDIWVWFFRIGDGYGKSEHKWKIPNKCKPRGGGTPTPAQQDAIDRLIIRADEAVETAEESAAFLRDASATATTLPSDSEATAELNDGEFTFGIPRGERGEPGPAGEPGAKGDPGTNGDPGNGIASIEKTGTSGAVDTYTITYTDGTTGTFTVTNGHIDNVDPTLSLAGHAADAAKVGELKSGFTQLSARLTALGV